VTTLKVGKIRFNNPLEVYKELGDGVVSVEFDDGDIIDMNTKELCVSHYMWKLLDGFPTRHILSNYIVSNYYDNGFYNSGSLNKLGTTIWQDLYNDYLVVNNIDSYENADTVIVNAGRIMKALYGDLGRNIDEYGDSLDIFDLYEILEHEDNIELSSKARIDQTQESISESYKGIEKTLSEPRFKDNPVAIGFLSGNLNRGQLIQAIAPRGFTSDMTNKIFKYPVIDNFTYGLKDLYSMFIESRSAAKALEKSTSDIRDTEYLTRRIRLTTGPVEYIEDTDCGSKDYITWFVRDASAKNDADYKGDIPLLIGTWYLDETDNVEKLISAKDTHLIGKTIKIRTILTCKLKNQHNCCKRCYGAKSTSNYYKTFGVGKVSTTLFMTVVNQMQLSAKHLLTSTKAEDVIYDHKTREFIGVAHDILKINVMPSVTKTYKLIITQDELFGLKNLKVRDSFLIDKLDPSRISKVSKAKLEIEVGGKVTSHILNVKYKNRNAILTKTFIRAILESGYTLREDDTYEIPLTKEICKLPFATLEVKDYSFSDLGQGISNIFKILKDDEGNVVKNPEAALYKFVDLISSKMQTGISDCAVLIYAYSSRSDTNFLLPRELDKEYTYKQFNGEGILATKRTLSIALGGDRALSKIFNVNSFSAKNRLDGSLDVLFHPQQVLRFRTTYLD